jgi:hypothetical protein
LSSYILNRKEESVDESGQTNRVFVVSVKWQSGWLLKLRGREECVAPRTKGGGSMDDDAMDALASVNPDLGHFTHAAYQSQVLIEACVHCL